MEWLYALLGIVIVLAFAGIYILTTIINKKTKVPEGCEFAHLEANCGACLSKTCEMKKEKKVNL
ncbi:MAG: hypothetical protein ACOX5X_02150 [Acholeplasmataceae bacterium]|jgi:hypothetical protein